jgi:hypothetical protein
MRPVDPAARAGRSAPTTVALSTVAVLLVSGGVWQAKGLLPATPDRSARTGSTAGEAGEDDDKFRKPASGLDDSAQTVVEREPRRSAIAPGFDSERVWSGVDDWEPALAADRNSSYVYQVTTRLNSGRATIWFRRSADSGATWEPDYRPLPDNKHQADPQIEVDGNGTVYLAFLHLSNTALMKSFDHGATWTDAVHLPLGGVNYVDHELLAVSEDGQDVYIAFNANHSYVSTSHDGGRTFAEPVKTNNDFRQWFHTAYAIAPTGEVYFAVQDYAQTYQNQTNIKLLKSVDAGLSWQTYFVDVSEEAPLCQWAKGCYHGFLGPTAGLARDANGVLAMVYNAGSRPQANNRIWFRTSLDGVTWSARQAISANDPSATNAFPLVVAGSAPGDFRAVWQGGPPNTFNTWYRRTTDGGATWGPILRLSDLGTGAPYKWANGYFFPYGDYWEIAVDGNDVNHLLWGEGRNYIGPGGSWYTRGQ